MSAYHFITRWEMPATCEEIYRILEEAEQLAVWWPSVYLDVKVLTPEIEGVGKKIALYTKGWLPYTLRWQFVVTAREFPKGFSIEAIGDFVGTGVWTFNPLGDGSRCEIIYDWRISAEKPLLKYLSFIMRPLFSANHHWAMRQGEKSLLLELRRRHATTEAECRAVPPPPPPTFPHNLMRNKVF